jgi:crossover junction endodeoxyribonuclease RuvC
MKYTKYIGIDPGISGAIASITSSRETPLITIWDTPTIGVTRRSHNPLEMIDILHTAVGTTPLYSCMIALEDIHAFPGVSAVSMFNLGESCGIWKGIIAALKIPHTLVKPTEWKRMLVGMKANKEMSRAKALQLFPSVYPRLKRKQDEGRAEALLIAEWLRRKE